MPTFPSCDRSTLLGGAGVKFTARAGAEASEDRVRRYERGESERRPRASWRRRKGIRMAREVAAAGLNRQLTVPGCDGVHCRRGQLCSSRRLRAGRSSQWRAGRMGKDAKGGDHPYTQSAISSSPCVLWGEGNRGGVGERRARARSKGDVAVIASSRENALVGRRPKAKRRPAIWD